MYLKGCVGGWGQKSKVTPRSHHGHYIRYRPAEIGRIDEKCHGIDLKHLSFRCHIDIHREDQLTNRSMPLKKTKTKIKPQIWAEQY